PTGREPGTGERDERVAAGGADDGAPVAQEQVELPVGQRQDPGGHVGEGLRWRDPGVELVEHEREEHLGVGGPLADRSPPPRPRRRRRRARPRRPRGPRGRRRCGRKAAPWAGRGAWRVPPGGTPGGAWRAAATTAPACTTSATDRNESSDHIGAAVR